MIGRSATATLGRLRDQAAPTWVGLPLDVDKAGSEVDVADDQTRNLTDPHGRGGKKRHHIAPALLVVLPDDGRDQAIQGGDIRQRKVARVRVVRLRHRAAPDVLPAGTVLSRVPRDQSVTHRLVQDEHERGHGVLDGGGPVLGLPPINGPVDDTSRDHRHWQLAEGRQHPAANPSRIRIHGG